jgi:hypothetical protein
MRFLLAVNAVLAFSAAGWAQSQYARPLPPPRPVVSPYLNLLRSGNSQAFNYLTLVRPELDIRSSVDVLQKDANQQKTAAIMQAYEGGEVTTGHAFGFMTHNRYFMTTGTGRTGFSTLSQPVANRGAAPRASIPAAAPPIPQPRQR